MADRKRQINEDEETQFFLFSFPNNVSVAVSLFTDTPCRSSTCR